MTCIKEVQLVIYRSHILVALLRYPLLPVHPVCPRLLDPPILAFCLS
jgi:hypothetical protein